MRVFGFVLVISDIWIVDILISERFSGPGFTGVGAYTFAVVFDHKMHRQLMIAHILDALMSGTGFLSHVTEEAPDAFGSTLSLNTHP